MQQGHPRHKQLNRARHEMAMHRRYMFAKKINKGMHSEMHNPKGLMQIVPPKFNE